MNPADDSFSRRGLAPHRTAHASTAGDRRHPPDSAATGVPIAHLAETGAHSAVGGMDQLRMQSRPNALIAAVGLPTPGARSQRLKRRSPRERELGSDTKAP
jgi:hypothetical protein